MPPVNTSRLTVPQVPRALLWSDRLRSLQIGDARIVEVVAPAGYGKTTAIATALAGKRRVHWYRLDADDRRLPIFYAHLTECLLGRDRRADEPESAAYLRAISDLAEGYPLLNAAICQDVWHAYGSPRTRHRYLVLDDFHQAASCAPIVETVRYLVVNLPPNIHVILASRIPTGVLDGGLGLSDTVVRISERDLAFTNEETSTYALRIRGMGIAPDMLSEIQRRTEGWAAGVVMACNALEQASRSNVPVGATMPKTLNADTVFRYFLTEVLSGPEATMAHQLAVVATLDEFTVADIEAAFGIEDGENLVALCLSHNLFLQQAVGAQTTYRFHSLFRDALLTLRNAHLSRPEVIALESAAASHYLERDDVLKAAGHLIRAGELGHAVELLSIHGLKLMHAGSGENLLMLLEQLPPAVVASSPYLSFYAGFAVLNRDFDRARALLITAADGFAAMGAADLEVQVVAVLFTAYAQRNDVEMMGQLVSRLERLASSIQSEPVRGVLLACRLGQAAFSEHFDLGLEIERQLTGIKLDEVWRHAVNNFLAMIHYRLGDLAAGRRFIEQNQILDVVRTNDQWRILNLVICHTIALYQNDQAWSTWIRSELLALGEQYGSSYALSFGKKDAAIERHNAHDLAAAIELIDASTHHFRLLRNTAQMHRGALYRNLWLTEVDLAQVRLDEAMQACNYLSLDKAGQGFAETAQSFLGVILRELGQLDSAREQLTRSMATSTAKSALQSMAGTAMHLAKLHYDLGQQGPARENLAAFITTAADHGFAYFYDLHFPTLVEMAARCVVEELRPEYALSLIGRYYGSDAVRYLAGHALRLCRPEEARAFAANRGRPAEGGRVIEVRLLGDFRIRIGDEQVAETEWRTRKAQRILRYLILRRNQYVPRETIAGLFWPDTERRAAMASTNVAMHELRRVLARHRMAPEDETPLVSERLDGYEVRTSDRLVIDIDVMVQLAGRWRNLASMGRDPRPVLREMAELYRGDLLPQDQYEDWAEIDRSYLRGLFLDAVRQLAALEIRDANYHEAEPLLVRGLRFDPYDEAMCSMLLGLYRSTGQVQAAEHLYLSFVERYRRELGTRPKLAGHTIGDHSD